MWTSSDPNCSSTTPDRELREKHGTQQGRAESRALHTASMPLSLTLLLNHPYTQRTNPPWGQQMPAGVLMQLLHSQGPSTDLTAPQRLMIISDTVVSVQKQIRARSHFPHPVLGSEQISAFLLSTAPDNHSLADYVLSHTESLPSESRWLLSFPILGPQRRSKRQTAMEMLSRTSAPCPSCTPPFLQLRHAFLPPVLQLSLTVWTGRRHPKAEPHAVCAFTLTKIGFHFSIAQKRFRPGSAERCPRSLLPPPAHCAAALQPPPKASSEGSIAVTSAGSPQLRTTASPSSATCRNSSPALKPPSAPSAFKSQY